MECASQEFHPVAGLRFRAPCPEQSLCVVYADNDEPSNQQLAEQLSWLEKFTKGMWADWQTTNQHTGGKAAKFAASLIAGGVIAKNLEVTSPGAWALNRFGPLPLEMTRNGALQVFRLSKLQRLGFVAVGAGVKYALITLISFHGGVFVGSVINAALPKPVKHAIGGTINEIVNEGGWRELWRHPFGMGLF